MQLTYTSHTTRGKTCFSVQVKKYKFIHYTNISNYNKNLIINLLVQIFSRLLATGRSYSDLSFSFKIGISTISEITKETLNKIWSILSPIYMSIPNVEDFLNIAKEFEVKCDFPHCIGAIDGRHVRIKKPPNSGSLYNNYKKFFSVIFQVLVDANKRYLFIDVGDFGSQNDASVFRASTFYNCLTQKKIKIPQESKIANTEITMPYVFVGDGAYPLMHNMMKLFRGYHLSRNQLQFNQKLSSARVMAENAFGLTCENFWPKSGKYFIQLLTNQLIL